MFDMRAVCVLIVTVVLCSRYLHENLLRKLNLYYDLLCSISLRSCF